MIDVSVTPQLAARTAHEAIKQANRWLQREVGPAVQVATAVFDPATFYWHLPVELAYGVTGPLGVIGDLYLHAVTGVFAGAPQAAELRQRAEALAAAHGIE